MTFDEYVKSGRANYEALIVAVQTILGAAIKRHDLVPHDIKGRAKDPASLAKKLKMRKIDPASAIDAELKDLAGVRIVFLTNGQVDQFNQTGILRENFEVLNVNVHHPVPGTETEDRLFDSTNYLVALKPERLALPEYAAFAGLRCEIQIQTLLNHAWAEMDHDAFYKQPDIGRIGEKRLNVIKKRMDDVMRHHLVPAGHDFDQIAGEMRRLIEADGSFDATFATLADSSDNLAITQALATFAELILPQVDEPFPLFLKHLPSLIGAVERTRGSAAVRNETPYGSYPGADGEDVAHGVAELIGKLRYADPAATLDALLRLHAGAVSDKERKIWTDVGRQLSTNNLHVWKQHGPAIARIILDGIAKRDAPARATVRHLLVVMLGNILSADVEGMSSAGATVTIHQGVVPVSDNVIAIRREAMAILEQLLDEAPSDAERLKVLRALRGAGRPPFNGAGVDLAILVRRDAARILRIEAARAAGWSLELRRQSEMHALEIYHLFSVLPELLERSDAAAAAQAEVIEAIAALRGALAGDAEYGLYRLLVGRGSVRPDAWEEDGRDWRKTAVWRSETYPQILGAMGDADAEAWLARVRLFVAQARAGNAELFPLGDFVRLVGKDRPKVAAVFLEAMEYDFSVVLRPLLLGLDEGGEGALVRRYVARWQGQGRFFAALGDYLRHQDPPDVDMLAEFAARAIELSDEPGVLAAVAAAVARYDKVPERLLIDAVFMPAIAWLEQAQEPEWVQHIWGGGEGKLVSALDDGEAKRLLDSFAGASEIGFEEDRILAFVAARFPGLVLDFFEARVRHGREDSAFRYTPIPYDVHELRDALVPYPELLIAATRRWYEIEPLLHEFNGGRLFHNIYPELPDGVAERLRELIARGDSGDIGFVLGLLGGYEGSDLIYPLCMDIVEALGEGDCLLSEVARVLARTGVLTGEFGFVAAEAAQRERIEAFKEDPRPKVQAFVREQEHRIRQSMAAEQRRAAQRVAAQKREWGEE